jgi:hypothetical protein
MPWEALLGGATGLVAIAIVIAVVFLKSATEKLVDGAEKRFESALRRSEELHRSLLTTATTIDTDLRTHRIEVYAELWKMTGSLPNWPRNLELTYQDLQSLTNELRTWYFERGGMYLSAGARKGYGDVQESLASVLKDKKDGKVSDSDYDAIRAQCSALRSELTRDLLSRREAPDISAATK